MTKLFAPSRAARPSDLKAAKAVCVCCNPSFGGMGAGAEDEADEAGDGDALDDEEEEDDDDDDDLDGFIVRDGDGEDSDDSDEGEEAEAEEEQEEAEEEDGLAAEPAPRVAAVDGGAPVGSGRPRGPPDACSCGKCTNDFPAQNLVQLPRTACGAAEPHWVHACCAAEVLASPAYPACPRCRLQRRMLKVSAGGGESDGEDGANGEDGATGEDGGPGEDGGGPEGTLICSEVADANGVPFGGLRLSTKLIALRRQLAAVPSAEKSIVYSNFKGGLDLVEAMLSEDGVRCCRFDGDDPPAERSEQLATFKSRPEIRVLLLCLSAGSVGLNIADACHGFFLDVWWNPFVHRQCEDRMHRIGQTRPVAISYLLASSTFDEVIYERGHTKREAASTLLGIGGTAPRGGQSERLAGLLKGLLGQRTARQAAEALAPPAAPAAEDPAGSAGAGQAPGADPAAGSAPAESL